MAQDMPASASGGSCRFRQVAAAFLASAAVPFARIVSAERVERVFAKHDGLFGRQGVYSTAMMVWSFLGQVLRDGKEASCQAAVARVVSHCERERIAPPTADTGDYCRARAKLSEAALHELGTCKDRTSFSQPTSDPLRVSCGFPVCGFPVDESCFGNSSIED